MPSPRASAAPPSRTVDRRPDLAPRDFEHEYRRRRTPVVIPAASARVWQGAEPLSFDWLRRHHGHLRLDALGSGATADLALRPEHARRFGTLGGYLDALELGAAAPPAAAEGRERAGVPYLANLLVHRHLEGMVEGLRSQTELLGPNWLRHHPDPSMRLFGAWEIYVGPRGTGFGQLHADLWRGWVVTHQVAGKKTWNLFAPSDSARLYPMPDGSGMVHLSEIRTLAYDAASLAAYPKALEATRWVMDLEPGDLAFVPPSWWHGTVHREPSFACSYRHLPTSEIGPHLGEYAVGFVTSGATALHRAMVLGRSEPHGPPELDLTAR